jgi:hypothetical protein
MSELTFFFEDNALAKTVFRSDKQVRVAFRGRFSSSNSGTFPWSDGVKALSLLAIGASLDPNFELKGKPGSSLWLAIRRGRTWVFDIFGGSNPPIRMTNDAIRLQEGVVVNIVVNNCNPTNSDLHNLWSLINGKPIQIRYFRSMDTAISNSKEHLYNPWDDVGLSQMLVQEFLGEMNQGLFRTPLFSNQSSLLAEVQSVSTNAYLMKIGGRGFNPVHRSEIELGSNPVACFSETSFFKETKPFVLGVGPGGITTIAIAKYMKKFLGYPIEVNYHFPNSQDITKSVIKGEFDPAMAEGVVLSQTCTSRLSNSKCAYKPFMLVPGTTNMLLSTKSIEKRDISGSFSFLTDQESAATLIFHDLVVSGYFKKDLIEPIYFEPGNTLSKEIDFSILWWPYYRFNELLGKAKRVPSFKDSFCHFSVYMFVHEQLIAGVRPNLDVVCEKKLCGNSVL